MKILLVQTSFLGDTILSTPVISGIHQVYPDASIWMMTLPNSTSLIERDPLLSGTIPFDKRKKHSGIRGLLHISRQIKYMEFDIVYSLHRSSRTAILLYLSEIPFRIGFNDAKLNRLYTEIRFRHTKEHEVIRNLSILSGEISIQSLKTDLRLFAPEISELSKEVRQLLPSGDYVVIVPGSIWNTKRWQWEGYREAACYLISHGYNVVIDGAPSDAELALKIGKNLNVINLAAKSNISDAMYIIKNARLVICNDSMALHMASAFKTPCVAIFCATSPRNGFYPWKNNAIIVEKNDLACRPCGRHGGRKCPTGTYACIKELKPDKVIQAAEKLLL